MCTTGLAAFRSDRARYRRSAWVTQRAVWAIFVHRLGEELARAPAMPRRALTPLHAVLALLAQAVTGVEIGRGAHIGPGLLIQHGSGLVVHSDAWLGRDCVLLQGATVGNRGAGGCAPVIGDRVVLNSHAHVLGSVSIGNDVVVGALSLVLADVPAGTTVIGNPARPITSSAASR